MKRFMPEHYRFEQLPMHFNNYDPERIRKVVMDEASGFYSVRYKKAMFSVAG